MIVTDLRTDPRCPGASLVREHGVVSGVSVGLFGHDRPFGALCVHSTAARRFSEDATAFLQAVAHVLSTALERLGLAVALGAHRAHPRDGQQGVAVGRARLGYRRQRVVVEDDEGGDPYRPGRGRPPRPESGEDRWIGAFAETAQEVCAELELEPVAA